MSSEESSVPIDFEAEIRTTQKDVLALRKARQMAPMSPDVSLAFLAGFDAASQDVLRKRRGPRGDVLFRLVPS